MSEALGLLEIVGLTPSLVALDAMEKSANIRVLNAELNDFYGVSLKITGSVDDVTTAVERGRRLAQTMGGQPVADVIPHVDNGAKAVIVGTREYNPLIEQDVVFFPRNQSQTEDPEQPASATEQYAMNQETPSALGLIETQGFTAVFEAIDTACKAAQVEVVGKEKLGGGYITVIIQGDLSAVEAAVAAGKSKVEGLGKLIAAHVIARPSRSILGLLPKM
jgi:carbon dioxide concentrating mechanism protein CcmO